MNLVPKSEAASCDRVFEHGTCQEGVFVNLTGTSGHLDVEAFVGADGVIPIWLVRFKATPLALPLEHTVLLGCPAFGVVLESDMVVAARLFFLAILTVVNKVANFVHAQTGAILASELAGFVWRLANGVVRDDDIIYSNTNVVKI